MQVRFEDFDPWKFSFHEDPVLVLEEVWKDEERKYFQEAMRRAAWKPLRDMAHLHEAFPNCGNWNKAEIAQGEAKVFLDGLAFPCIMDYMESFPNTIRRHMSFNYYAYAAGDCLLTHDDTVQANGADGRTGERCAPLRRLAVVAYLHDEWQPDWGGELIVYHATQGQGASSRLAITHCIAPQPGSLVIFTVPRFHRVSRVDPAGGDVQRLSIAGWFMTEHDECSVRPPHVFINS
ncbi:MAG: 2OG-Fe(II) oxygenase [Nitrospiraceae bacterium]